MSDSYKEARGCAPSKSGMSAEEAVRRVRGDDEIIVKRQYQTGHRGVTTPTTINISLEAHALAKKLRDETGLRYSDLITLALRELDKRIVVKP